MRRKKTKYTCDICGNEYDDESEIVLHDVEKGYTICRGCFAKIARDSLMDNMMNDRMFDIFDSDPFAPLKEEANEGFHASTLITFLDHIIHDKTPENIKAHLDRYIVGQDTAKRVLSVAVYNHYKRLLFAERYKLSQHDVNGWPEDAPDELTKSNVLMIGPTGVGKTEMLKAIASYLDVPFAITDATTLTEAGYVGMDPETCVKNLWYAAGQDVDATQRGIIFIDEFDKLARKAGASRSVTADPGHEAVQQALLKIIEGGTVSFVPGAARRNPDMPGIFVDTTNILFIVGGAFEGIEKTIDARLSDEAGFGFSSKGDYDPDFTENIQKYNKVIHNVRVKDFTEYGVLPEILGRLPIICVFDGLTEDDLMRILTEPKNAPVRQYQYLLERNKTRLTFTEAALHAIAKKAIKTRTGARSLKAIFENILLETMYRVPTEQQRLKDGTMLSVTNDEENITKGATPEIVVIPDEGASDAANKARTTRRPRRPRKE